MTAALTQKQITVEEYLDFDEQSPEKNEFVNGRIVNMAGAMPDHGAISINIGGELRSCLKKTFCIVYGPDLRVRIGSYTEYVYPDLTIGCGKPLLDKRRKPYTLLNPIMIVEVLSPSTQNYDLTEKAQLYREQDTTQEIRFVLPDEIYVLHYSRCNDTTWTETTHLAMSDVVTLPSLGYKLPLDEIYLNIVFEAEEGD